MRPLRRWRRLRCSRSRCVPAHAQQAYPTRPVTLTHGFAAGGNGDVVSRIVGDALSKRLGQPVVVEPRPGAGGNTASQRLDNLAARRLHADFADQRPRGVGGDLQVAAVRSGRELPVHLDLRLSGLHDRGARRQSDQDHGRPDRRRQSRSRQAHLLVGRRRLDPASRRRTVRARWPASR